MCKVRIPGEAISVGILLKRSQSPIIDCFTIYITNVATMELLRNLFEGYPNLWGGGVAHSVLVLSLVIAFGIILGKVKVAGISLGVTWILFVGIVFGHFNLNLNEHLLHFLKEFGLILFVYSIGLQVGPGFFSAFRKGGLTLNMLAVLAVFVSVLTTVLLHFLTDIPLPQWSASCPEQ